MADYFTQFSCILPVGPGNVAADTADTLPDEDSGGDGLGDDDEAAAAGTDPAGDAGARLEDEPDPDAGPTVPPRRRRSRKDAGEDRASA